jgi:putative GTP pyrophosphokinase
MTNNISNAQVDKLGYRLRKGDITEADLRMLDEYRRSFSEAYEFVVGAIRNELGLEPTGRPAKSTTSISEKLLRESIRLTQIQDVAGCRLIVDDVPEQEEVVMSLTKLFTNATIVDRREQPSHGYRAVHVIVKDRNKLVEVQIRTSLQHAWAELSEKLSDVVNPAIKYGGGDKKDQDLLTEYSGLIVEEESFEAELARDAQRLSVLLSHGNLTQEEHEAVSESRKTTDATRERVLSLRQRMLGLLRKAIENLPERKL